MCWGLMGWNRGNEGEAEEGGPSESVRRVSGQLCLLQGNTADADGGLKPQTLASHSSGAWKSEIRVPAWLGSGGGPPPSL